MFTTGRMPVPQLGCGNDGVTPVIGAGCEKAPPTGGGAKYERRRPVQKAPEAGFGAKYVSGAGGGEIRGYGMQGQGSQFEGGR